MNETTTKIDTLIIGFGLCAMPLVRELERSGRDYKVISSGPSVWDHLEKAGRLDFDLVSSYMSTVYSFELARSRNMESRFLTARDYQAFLKRNEAELGKNVVEDWVTLVESHQTHSVVHTKSGMVYEVTHLVIATAFRRKIHGPLADYDFDAATGRTVVLTMVGDSTNLMTAKLVPRGNRVILLSNGFFCLDKLITHKGKTYALDDVEMHNTANVLGFFYKIVLPQGQILAAGNPKLCKPFFRSNLFVKHPLVCRNLDRTPALSMGRGRVFTPELPNGLKIIKYWAIDVYKELFDSKLEESIDKGFLLTDLAYFIDRGLVELWPLEETTFDRENRVIEWKGQVVHYDDLIEGDQEIPNLPKITIVRPDQPSYDYQYFHRNCFMGVAPHDLPNTYMIGYSRPMTGGLNNLSEMQCLFTHKLITDDAFRREITHNLPERIASYNAEHYPSALRVGADNLVFYGQYTERLGRLMGIESRLSDCRSLEDVSIHFFFPNAPCKYRRTGPYAVEGMDEVVREIHRAHDGFSIASSQLYNYLLMLVTAVAALVQLWRTQLVPLPLSVCLLLLLAVVFGPVLPLVNTNSNRINGFTNTAMVIGLGLTLWFGHPLIPLGSLAFNFLAVYIARKLRISRAWFNDLHYKDKPEYREFYERYRVAFLEVFAARASKKKESEGA